MSNNQNSQNHDNDQWIETTMEYKQIDNINGRLRKMENIVAGLILFCCNSICFKKKKKTKNKYLKLKKSNQTDGYLWRRRKN